MFELKEMPEVMIGVPILARIWHEDEVWNVSAFDVPVMAYGDDFDRARANFEEAVLSHFQALQHFGELDQVASDLRSRAEEMGFYTSRVRPKTLIENFAILSPNNLQLCSA